jgi:dihydrofolate reductase
MSAAEGVPVIGLIWAEAHDGVIGADGVMPWHLPEDLAHFSRTTMGSPVVMGRKTWDSLPERFRPLPGRANIVITRTPGWHVEGAVTAGSIEEALALAASDAEEGVHDEFGELVAQGVGQVCIWVIGGAQVFAHTIDLADRLVVTELDLDVEGDTRAPERGAEWRVESIEPETGWHTSRSGIRYRFITLTR